MHQLAESILPVERDFFLFLSTHHSAFFDCFMMTVTGRRAVFLYLILAVFVLYTLARGQKWQQTLLLFAMVALAIFICDQLASSVCKPLFERLRPSQHPDFKDLVVLVDGYKGGKYGFASSHAANSFGMAIFLSLLLRNRWLIVCTFLWACLFSYSRIYLGVHFVSDIVAGALIGLAVGTLFYFFYRRASAGIDVSNGNESLKKRKAAHIAAALLAYIIIALIMSAIKIL